MGFSEGPEREKIGQGLKMKRDWAGTGNGRNSYKVGEGASCSKVWVIRPGGDWTKEVRGQRRGQERALRRPEIGV